MPEIRITLDDYAFVWDGTEAEAAALVETELAVIAREGLDPTTDLSSLAASAPTMFRGGDPDAAGGARLVLIAWTLLQNVEHPDFPGRVIDYLPAADFEVVITEINRRKMTVVIAARPRAEFAGTA